MQCPSISGTNLKQTPLNKQKSLNKLQSPKQPPTTTAANSDDGYVRDKPEVNPQPPYKSDPLELKNRYNPVAEGPKEDYQAPNLNLPLYSPQYRTLLLPN